MTNTRIRRIVVAAGFEAGSNWAHAINTVNMAQGFSQLGHDVTLVCCHPGQRVTEGELVEELGLTAPMKWVQLRSRLFGIDLKRWLGFSALAGSTIARLRPELVYARDFDVPRLTTSLGITAVAETHAPVGSRSAGLLRLAHSSQHPDFACLVTISQTLADYYVSLGVPPEKTLVRPGGVDLRKFSKPSPLPPRPFPDGGPNVVYAGHLYDYNGIPTLIAAARQLPNVRFHLVGGWPADIARHKVAAANLSNVVFHGAQPHAHVPAFLWHADLLLLPASARVPAARWMSPVKLGECLASGTPALVSDIPAFRNWLSEEEVAFVRADDPGALSQGIQEALSAPARARDRAAVAMRKAGTWSIRLRAQVIIDKCELPG